MGLIKKKKTSRIEWLHKDWATIANKLGGCSKGVFATFLGEKIA